MRNPMYTGRNGMRGRIERRKENVLRVQIKILFQRKIILRRDNLDRVLNY